MRSVSAWTVIVASTIRCNPSRSFQPRGSFTVNVQADPSEERRAGKRELFGLAMRIR